jgi:hypothetical protein
MNGPTVKQVEWVMESFGYLYYKFFILKPRVERMKIIRNIIQKVKREIKQRRVRQ